VTLDPWDCHDRDHLEAFETEMRVLDGSAISLERDFRTHESIEKLSPVQGSAQYGLAGKRTRRYR
jgi:hypothetical protein